MNYFNQCIQVAAAFSQRVEVGFDIKNRYLIHIAYCSIKEGVLLCSLCGRGLTLEQAALDFLNQLKGKHLVYDPPELCGSRKEMIVCVIDSENYKHID